MWPREVKGARALLISLGLLLAVPALAEVPSYSSARLGQLVARIALYPDPLLAQVLAAMTFPDQISDATRWAEQHHGLAGQALAEAMQADHLPWDPTVQAMLPFPFVLDMMIADMNWTTNLGTAFLAQQKEVLDAVQRQRATARDFGYLIGNDHVSVTSKPYVAVMPVNPAHIFIPSYDPQIIFSPPPPGFALADAIRYTSEVAVGGFQPFGWKSGKFQVIGGYFQAWGWGLGGIDWDARSVIINGAPWQRNWVNRGEYVHRYPDLQRTSPAE